MGGSTTFARASTSSTTRSKSRPTPSTSRAATFASSFQTGLDLIRRGEFFAAHEELELAWRAAEDPERDFFQGLVHVAVAWYQAQRGNRVGCERQLAKATRRLGPYGPAHRGVDVEDVLAQVHDAQALVAAGSLDLPPPRV
jgi:predicted metal-dependent hydrolase